MELNAHSEEHGGIDPSELKKLGIAPVDLIDFSVNSNPFGPSPRVLNAIQSVDISTYPDRHCTGLKEALAQSNQVSPEHILIGNGTAELIWLIVLSSLKPGDKVLIVGPTFGEYRRAATAVGAQVQEIRAEPPRFFPPVDQVIKSIERDRPRLVFLCNPSNPTGVCLSSDVIEMMRKTCDANTTLVLDEAYCAFTDRCCDTVLPGGNHLVLRSMTKDFALAGLRLGYVIGDPALIERIKHFQPAWSVNSLAQAAGIAAIMDEHYYQSTLSKLVQLRNAFFSQIKNLGYAMIPSDVHFGMIHADSPAKELRLMLLKSGIQVRDCTSFGLPEYIRISTRKEQDNMKLIQALKILQKNNPSPHKHKEEVR